MNDALEHSGGYLYEEVVNKIAGMIGQGVLRPGERIPSIRKVSSQLDVSISTVLQAYLRLESRGLISASAVRVLCEVSN